MKLNEELKIKIRKTTEFIRKHQVEILSIDSRDLFFSKEILQQLRNKGHIREDA